MASPDGKDGDGATSTVTGVTGATGTTGVIGTIDATGTTGESAPLAAPGDGVHYYFPVEITVVEKQAAVGEVHYHFPVEIALVDGESAFDVDAAADRVLDKLARQLERERTGRG